MNHLYDRYKKCNIIPLQILSKSATMLYVLRYRLG